MLYFSVEDYCADDGSTLDPAEVHSYLSRVMYGRRSKRDPLWNQVVVAGVKDDKMYEVHIVEVTRVCHLCVFMSAQMVGVGFFRFLGSVDLYGTTFVDDIMATGFGMPTYEAQYIIIGLI